jgi:transketolase
MVEKGSIRKAYGQALAEYGAINPGVVVLDADVSSSTQTHIFAKLFPDRFFNVGITEAGMVDVAVGLALGGEVPFVNTFAALLALRALEQIRTCVAYARTNVKLVAGYAGLSDFKDGVTHNCICDLAIMRAMPNLAVVVAADAVEVQKMVPAVAEYDGPVYFRVSRTDWPIIFGNTHEMEIGKGVVLRGGRDVTLIGTGLMVYRCMRAADVLAEEGIDARVLEIHTLKPFDVGLVREAAEETGAIITAEEHSIIGGLGGAVAECLGGCCPVPIERVGIRDTFGVTALDIESLLDHCGMAIEDIVGAARRVIARK